MAGRSSGRIDELSSKGRSRRDRKGGQNNLASRKKTTVNLSIDDTILKEVRKEAEIDRTSLNAKINSILDRYVNFFKYAQSMGAVIIPQIQFSNMLELMDEAQLTQIMKYSGNANVTAMLNLLGIPPDLNSLCKYCFDRYIKWSGAYHSFNWYIDKEGYACLVFEHKFGMKWSRIMAEALSDAVHQVLAYPTEKKTMPATIVLRVMERGLSLDDI